MLSVAADHAGTALPFPVATVSVAGVVGGVVSAGPNGAAFEAADRLPPGKQQPAAILAGGEPFANATTVRGGGPAGMPVSVNVGTSGPTRPTAKVCGPAGMPVSVNVV